jgi:hypothetical protein
MGVLKPDTGRQYAGIDPRENWCIVWFMKTINWFVFLVCTSPALGASPTVDVVFVKKIWDQAPHNAFTDLAFWKGQFMCAFREGRAHVATDGRIRVLSSADGENWSPAASIELDGFDLRDASLTVMPDNRLMLNGGAAPRKTDKDRAPTGTFVAFSDDGTSWTKPKIIVEPGRWLWRVSWHDGKAYGVSYSSTRPATGNPFTALMVSDDGEHFRDLVPKLLDNGVPTEATLRFAKDGTMYCLQRRDAKSQPPKSAFFGESRPPYTDWQWHDLKMHVGGPNFIRLPSGQWIAAGRFFDKKPVTKVAALDVEKKTIEPLLTLPSGGDTSYPGLVWHEDALWMSYYSSHEGKTSIYVAKLRVR